MKQTEELQPFIIVAAVTGVEENIIGTKDILTNKLRLPWRHLHSDSRNFFTLTTSGKETNYVIVGRKTFETMPRLKGRETIVISSHSIENEFITVVNSFDKALLYASERCKGTIFVIGGEGVYREAIVHPKCIEIVLTKIQGPVIGDLTVALFPDIPTYFKPYRTSDIWKEDDYILKTINFVPDSLEDNKDEKSYLKLIGKILSSGCEKPDRTGVGVLSLFGQTLNFNFKRSGPNTFSFPLLTTKKIFTKGIIKELLFFLRGDVDNSILTKDGVNIWTGNTTREFLDKRGMIDFEEGSLGKAYGFQWRFWGANWMGKNFDYKNEVGDLPNVYDQLSIVLNLLKTDPFSRRIILSAWNVADLKHMCLEPCHTLYTFNVQIVDNTPKLFCHLTQRSGDIFLGVPFNIASTALLTLILAKASGLEPGGIMMSIVDAHIYKNHIEQCTLQISRKPYEFPSIEIVPNISTIFDIENLKYEDFIISNYKYHPPIKADMAI